MESLKGSERNLLLLGFCIDKTGTLSFKQTLKTIILLLTLTITGLCPIGGYVITNLSNTFGAIFASMVFTAIVSVWVSVFTVSINRQSVRGIIDTIRQVTEKEKNVEILKKYEYNEKLDTSVATRGLLYASIWIFIQPLLLSFGSIMYDKFHNGTLDPHHWLGTLRYFKRIVDKGTVPGYILALVNDIILCGLFFLLNPVVLLFFITTCLYLRSFCELFKSQFDTIDDNFLSKRNHDEAMLKAKIQFSRAVNLHNTIKIIFNDLSTVMNGTILSQLIYVIIDMATSAYHVSIVYSSFANINVMLIVSAFYNTGSALLYCYLGEMTFISIENLNRTVYQTKWYLYPNSLQKCLLIVCGNSQQVKYFSGFGMVHLSLNTFSKMANTALSYFLMFERLGSV